MNEGCEILNHLTRLTESIQSADSLEHITSLMIFIRNTKEELLRTDAFDHFQKSSTKPRNVIGHKKFCRAISNVDLFKNKKRSLLVSKWQYLR